MTATKTGGAVWPQGAPQWKKDVQSDTQISDKDRWVQISISEEIRRLERLRDASNECRDKSTKVKVGDSQVLTQSKLGYECFT